jgi:hypothetical protein
VFQYGKFCDTSLASTWQRLRKRGRRYWRQTRATCTRAAARRSDGNLFRLRISDTTDHSQPKRSDADASAAEVEHSSSQLFDASPFPAVVSRLEDHRVLALNARTAELMDGRPPELDDLVLECLSKDPALRPASAESLVERLEHLPLAAGWNQRRAREWWLEHEADLVT